ncbi:MAG: phosphoribosylformylglycinamidine synthase [Peptostreptococcus sp.]|uniref:phosphoribosylformylglycinamidine synthase n=1 Tax=Peptostreptococcus TaxID=1257 RepID=UPI0029143A42|nr:MULTISPECIES: phosphoribosylformylglycinamidine synthase [Peptostreptococcus]MDU3423055.1 phosphoribosylformylglycinamidine synthase [Peptostreptococcus anaerobius]MDU3429941.1 phosphoribosylformylglycinamidine synthase [Peptostreptococcus sp.]MDU3455257.1 phosphoribosylformylglycinamidine synthase [Peptostreptococcus sp.]MDU5681255.1 phosphoribosylformylglycinamidine synthase [Peptostreptococcus sp.]MDU5738229.1 phosphoribosylformylglycinamidine synthase [Peptostreptococcus sp.]
MSRVNRVFVEKKDGFDLESKAMQSDILDSLHISVEGLRVINRYDIEGIGQDVYKKVAETILSEPNLDNVYYEEVPTRGHERMFAIEYLPGQYDQRADWAAMCAEIVNDGNRPIINSSKLIIIGSSISDEEFAKIKDFSINAVDSREASLDKPETLEMVYDLPESVATMDGFIDLDQAGLESFLAELGLAMTIDDLKMVQEYFRDDEKRNPTITEIKVLDTYWSDHCRHTTFMTRLANIDIPEGRFTNIVKETYDRYLEDRKFVYGDKEKDICLMDMATVAMKKLKKEGKLADLDESEEINACSINIDVEIDGKKEEYLLMFKNETHNHPTEIEPFGGAATCLGGAIRDPLSGRSYVYQAMRVTGSADPRTSLEDTLAGKLMQKKITTGAANGYSSYGNQIGLSTGQVSEVYDEDFVAKRMEVGAVIAAAPKENVIRKRPDAGDVIILLGGKTGRDGCGGATGSSKEHSEESISTCSAEVQKGDAPNERKIQRFFRNAEAVKMIKRCNDFGAGGVSVAIGEIADSLDINLDLVPKKYDGLDGTELAISESQERMAVAIEPQNMARFIELANLENLEATHVATVTDSGYMRMNWKGKDIVNIKRAFLDKNGCKQDADIKVEKIDDQSSYTDLREVTKSETGIKDKYMAAFKDLNVCSQRGLVEKFDNTIGASTVILPFGGKYQATPANGMVAKIPLLKGTTNTSSIMTYGYNPKIGKWSTFHGAMNAVVESVAKLVALGGEYSSARLTFQEYFERLGKNPSSWGKPFAALLGAYYAQTEFEIPAIGGKDSMSGTFKDINVPPTLVSFAVNTQDAGKVVSQEIKKAGSKLVLVEAVEKDYAFPDFDQMKKNFDIITKAIMEGKVLTTYALGFGGLGEALAKMAFGNKIGLELSADFEASMESADDLFRPSYGSIVLEMAEEDLGLLEGATYKLIGQTIEVPSIKAFGESISLNELLKASEGVLESTFPTKASKILTDDIRNISFERTRELKKASISIAKPRVFIPAFPGTNCEYDSARAFERAGAEAKIGVFRNMTYKDIESSIDMMVDEINNSQIIMIPGGFSAGDEPDGSAKFIATVFRNPKIEEAVMKLLNEKDGLMIGICNGFQALIKLGLVPYGEIMTPSDHMPTLTYNNIGRHQAKMVRTRVASNKSPWLAGTKVGDVHSIAISHGEGKFVASEEVMKSLIENGQIATQYVDFDGNATYDIDFNPNGSYYAVEGITSADGRVLGKMGHSERIGENVVKNIVGAKDQHLFESGVKYFK